MPFKFNTLGPPFDIVGAAANTANTTNIPEYSTDPISPAPQAAWVLRSGAGGTVTGGGLLHAWMGLGFPYIMAGVSSGSSFSYQFSYRTLEGTTKRATIS